MSMDPLGPVVITSREIYDQLVRVGDAVASLSTRIDRLTDALVETKQDLADHESRLRSLERARWPLPSLAAAVSITALGIALLPMLTR